jgi:hypothetical protein
MKGLAKKKERNHGQQINSKRAKEEELAQQHNPNPTTTIFNLDGPTTGGRPAPAIIADEEERLPSTAEEELLQYHHRFAHISFAKLQNMAKLNIIPKRLAQCQVPACGACLFAKATRRQWRNKRQRNWSNPREAFHPGQIVSVDQSVSPTVGLIPKMTGRLTTKRYKYATVFVDQFSGFSFVYLQKTAEVDETILAKKAFEETARQHGVEIKAYHADNGVFRSNKWVSECNQSRQRLTCEWLKVCRCRHPPSTMLVD